MAYTNKLQTNYPFLSCIKCSDAEHVGIIINFDNLIVSLYDVALIKTDDLKKMFLDMGETWWWESNRKIPINIFLKKDMEPFKFAIRTFNSKDAKLLFGPTINLSEIAEKRVKRKSIQLVRANKVFK